MRGTTFPSVPRVLSFPSPQPPHCLHGQRRSVKEASAEESVPTPHYLFVFTSNSPPCAALLSVINIKILIDVLVHFHEVHALERHLSRLLHLILAFCFSNSQKVEHIKSVWSASEI